MKKYDKSLIEVWEWKEKVYQVLKDLSDQEIIGKLKENTNRVFLESGLKLKVYKKDYQKTL